MMQVTSSTYISCTARYQLIHGPVVGDTGLLGIKELIYMDDKNPCLYPDFLQVSKNFLTFHGFS